MHFYVDGDNCPGSRTCGIEQLRETDVVKVFYAENCRHYKNEATRSALKDKCKGAVEFIKVKAGTNSVDFAMAVNVSMDCSRDSGLRAACLVSGDKHFDIVERELNRICQTVMVKRVETIEAGIQRYYMLEIDTLQQFHELLSKQFGADKGAKIYDRTEALFYEEFKRNGKGRKKFLGMERWKRIWKKGW